MIYANEISYSCCHQDIQDGDNSETKYQDDAVNLISNHVVAQTKGIDDILGRDPDHYLDFERGTDHEGDYSVNRELKLLDLSQALLHQELDCCTVPLTSNSSSLSSFSSSSAYQDHVAVTNSRDDPDADEDMSAITMTTSSWADAMRNPTKNDVGDIYINTSQRQMKSRILQFRLRSHLRVMTIALLVLISMLILFLLIIILSVPFWIGLTWLVMKYG